MKVYILVYSIAYEGSNNVLVSKNLDEIIARGDKEAQPTSGRYAYKKAGDGENTSWESRGDIYSIEVWEV